MIDRRSILSGAAALVSAAMLPAARGLVATSERESRTILNEGYNWLDRRFAAGMVKRLADAGFNVLITSVWHGAGTSWPSKVAPVALEYKGGDPFAVLLDLAQKQDIEVHAWFTVTLRQRDFLDDFRGFGTPADKFEVHSAAFRAFIRDVVIDFARRYPVQGVNLDYVRAGGISLSGVAQDDYAKRTGRTLLVDRTLATAEARASVERWQTSAITEIVDRISEGVRTLRPKALMSVDAAPWYPPYLTEGQDSLRWADEDMIDVLYSMNYQETLDLQTLNDLKARMHRPAKLVPIVSNYSDKPGPVPRAGSQVSSLIEQARTVSRDNGVAVYLYSMLDDAQVVSLRSGAFRQPAVVQWSRRAPS